MHDPAEGISPTGMIVTGARRECVPQAFEPVLSAVADLALDRDVWRHMAAHGRVLALDRDVWRLLAAHGSTSCLDRDVWRHVAPYAKGVPEDPAQLQAGATPVCCGS